MTTKRGGVEKALALAVQVIAQYEAEIRASAWTGVNLEAAGFCQGENYKTALATIDKIARGE
jgi:hypothetical protein